MLLNASSGIHASEALFLTVHFQAFVRSESRDLRPVCD